MEVSIFKLKDELDFAAAITIPSELLGVTIQVGALADRTRADLESSIISLLDSEDIDVYLSADSAAYFLTTAETDGYDFIDPTDVKSVTLTSLIDIPGTEFSVNEKYVWGAGGLALGLLLS